ncbi:SDR family NAD(P)-dependent oxidoreductase [Balneatrix alpica]|uniref:SDR family NAD(P)-dependent oxidoreductase n=1 Tax=Balneatrix alpica TaxID=75684 RepID=A0ABV5ZEM6_9GAMM|nr:SDR family NAD(P)-dependent oxidoreductase [Balneatrix alpica]
MSNVLITGANRGLGLALAHAFHKEGYGLYLVVRSEAAQLELSHAFPGANVLQCDLRDDFYESKLKEWLTSVTLDVVINNAGSGSKAPTLAETTAEHLHKEFETNCVAVLSTVKGCLSALQCSRAGVVINISSRRGSLKLQSEMAAKGSGCSYSYRISKAAQNMLTLCLADDLDEWGIKVIAVHPGRLLTKMASHDACMSADESAARIVELLRKQQFNSRDYICVENGILPW